MNGFIDANLDFRAHYVQNGPHAEGAEAKIFCKEDPIAKAARIEPDYMVGVCEDHIHVEGRNGVNSDFHTIARSRSLLCILGDVRGQRFHFGYYVL